MLYKVGVTYLLEPVSNLPDVLAGTRHRHHLLGLLAELSSPSGSELALSAALDQGLERQLVQRLRWLRIEAGEDPTAPPRLSSQSFFSAGSLIELESHDQRQHSLRFWISPPEEEKFYEFHFIDGKLRRSKGLLSSRAFGSRGSSLALQRTGRAWQLGEGLLIAPWEGSKLRLELSVAAAGEQRRILGGHGESDAMVRSDEDLRIAVAGLGHLEALVPALRLEWAELDSGSYAPLPLLKDGGIDFSSISSIYCCTPRVSTPASRHVGPPEWITLRASLRLEVGGEVVEDEQAIRVFTRTRLTELRPLRDGRPVSEVGEGGGLDGLRFESTGPAPETLTLTLEGGANEAGAKSIELRAFRVRPDSPPPIHRTADLPHGRLREELRFSRGGDPGGRPARNGATARGAPTSRDRLFPNAAWRWEGTNSRPPSLPSGKEEASLGPLQSYPRDYEAPELGQLLRRNFAPPALVRLSCGGQGLLGWLALTPEVLRGAWRPHGNRGWLFWPSSESVRGLLPLRPTVDGNGATAWKAVEDVGSARSTIWSSNLLLEAGGYREEVRLPLGLAEAAEVRRSFSHPAGGSAENPPQARDYSHSAGGSVENPPQAGGYSHSAGGSVENPPQAGGYSRSAGGSAETSRLGRSYLSLEAPASAVGASVFFPPYGLFETECVRDGSRLLVEISGHLEQGLQRQSVSIWIGDGADAFRWMVWCPRLSWPSGDWQAVPDEGFSKIVNKKERLYVDFRGLTSEARVAGVQQAGRDSLSLLELLEPWDISGGGSIGVAGGALAPLAGAVENSSFSGEAHYWIRDIEARPSMLHLVARRRNQSWSLQPASLEPGERSASHAPGGRPALHVPGDRVEFRRLARDKKDDSWYFSFPRPIRDEEPSWVIEWGGYVLELSTPQTPSVRFLGWMWRSSEAGHWMTPPPSRPYGLSLPQSIVGEREWRGRLVEQPEGGWAFDFFEPLPEELQSSASLRRFEDPRAWHDLVQRFEIEGQEYSLRMEEDGSGAPHIILRARKDEESAPAPPDLRIWRAH